MRFDYSIISNFFSEEIKKDFDVSPGIDDIWLVYTRSKTKIDTLPSLPLNYKEMKKQYQFIIKYGK